MTRLAREISSTGIYHIMVRGINRQNIFLDDDDRIRYLEKMNRFVDEENGQIMGYCLMNNHVHILLREGKTGIARIMKRIGTSYAFWYNWKYQRCGHVFQDRFKSECIEDDNYLKAVIRYIHQNPVKAGIVKLPELYRWSSCGDYYDDKRKPIILTKTEYILGLFGERPEKSLQEFKQFMEQGNEDKCLDETENKRLGDGEAKRLLSDQIPGIALTSIGELPKKERDEILRRFKQIKCVTIRQISRLTGIATTNIHRA
ncbi:MAG: transposase [Syntrophomonadaceae bacterium]